MTTATMASFCDTNKVLMEAAGTKTVLFEAVTPDAVDLSPIVRKLRHSKADIIVFGGYQPLASSFSSRCAEHA